MKYSLRNFIIALALGLVLFGAVGFAVTGYAQTFIVDLFTPNMPDDDFVPEENENIPSEDANTQVPTVDTGDNMTFLVVVLSENDKIESAEVVKFKETGNHTVIISLPSNLLMSDKSTLLLLEDMYTTFGLSYVADMATAYTGLPIDGYFVCYREHVDEIVSLCGNITVTLTEKISADGTTFSKGTNKLNGEKTYALLTAAKNTSIKSRTAVYRSVLEGVLKAMVTEDNNKHMCIDAQYPELLAYIDTDFPLSELTGRQEFLTKTISFDVNSAILPGTESIYDYTPPPEVLGPQSPPDPNFPDDPFLPIIPDEPEVIAVDVYLPNIQAALTAYKSYR